MSKNRKQRIKSTKTHNQNEPEDNTKKTSYPSAKLMLEVLFGEYKYEFDRKASIEARSGFILAFIGSVIVLIPTILGKPALFDALDAQIIIALKTIALLLYLVSYAFLVSAVYQVFKTLNTRDYINFDLSAFTPINAEHDEDYIAKALVVGIKDIIASNAKVNESKALHFKSSIKFIFASLVTITVYVILSIFI